MKSINYYTFLLLLTFFLTGNQELKAQNKGSNTCANAFQVEVSPTSGCQSRIEGENTTIANAAVINPPCDNAGINRDLWYSFVAPLNGEIAILVDLMTAFRVEGAIYTDCPAQGGANTSVYCNNTGLSAQIVKGLTPGDTYYLQLWSDDFATGTFSFCLSETEALGQQDQCSTPLYRDVINPDGCTPPQPDYIGDNFGATNDPNLPIPSCGSYGQGKDVWYAAVVPASGQIYAEVGDAGGPNDWVMAAYTGDCGNLTEIDCNDDAINFFPALSLSGLIPGDTILFRIWPYGGQDEGQFTLRLIDPKVYPPNNDNCATAQELTLVNTDVGCSIYKSCGTNMGASSSNAPTPNCGVFDGAKDVWYSVVVPSGGDLELTCSENSPGGNKSWSIAAYSGNCSNLSLLGCAEGTFLSYPTLSISGLQNGDTVYVRVSDNGNNVTGNFFLCAKTSGSLFAVHFENSTAYELEESNRIEWRFYASSEYLKFNIERSANGQDWTLLDGISIYSNEDIYYTLDPSPIVPTSYYRIIALTDQGEQWFSDILSVQRTNNASENILFPNPAGDKLHLSMKPGQFGDDILVEVFDLRGSRLISKVHDAPKGNILTLNVQQLPKHATYLLRISGSKYSKSFKFTK